MLPDRLLAAAARLPIFAAAVPLAVEVHQSADPIPLADAERADYRPASAGWRWGPVWSSAWFRLWGRVPASMLGRRTHLRFSSGTEALLWLDGAPFHGLDDNHTLVPLPSSLLSHGRLQLLIHAECIRPLGATTFFWDSPAEHQRWAEPDPGRLNFAELVVIDDAADRLRVLLEFVADLLKLDAPRDASRAGRCISGADRASDRDSLADAAERALSLLDRPAEAAALLESAMKLHPPPPGPRTHCLAVGHAHIDTAWLWTTAHTRRKCLRTFSTALQLMHEDAAFRFTCTQPQLYQWLEAESPGLFARIAQRVRDGRWEGAGGGAMWIEPDCNIPSGESLVRQILHARAYWQSKFPDIAPPTCLFLPDTFGFPATLPQIIAQAGLTTFITNKLAWNDTNKFPYSSFLWRGLDGTEVLSHCTPGHEYNATNTPRELRRAHDNLCRSPFTDSCLDAALPPCLSSFLQPFGFGDGGGGPTSDTLQRIHLANACPALPAIAQGTIRQFCDALHAARRDYGLLGRSLPVHAGDLYLERHRGTYTTQQWLKRSNRRAEQRLRIAEWLLAAGPGDAPPSADERGVLDEAWKLLLLNQFHDILPGSSIGAVYKDSRREMAVVDAVAGNLIRAGSERWAFALNGGTPLVFNPASSPRSGVAEHEGALVFVRDVPAIGVSRVPRASGTALDIASARADGHVLSNSVIRAAIDAAGRVSSLRQVRRDGRLGPEVCARGGTCHVALYTDTPRHWEAWDIDLDHARTRRVLSGAAARVEVVERGPLRAAIEVERPLGRASRMVMRYSLDAGSPRLDVRCRVDWRESRTLLRVLFPSAARSDAATTEVQFGHVRRALRARTRHDRARFEVCAQRWADVSDARGSGGVGLAVLNRGIYGHSCLDGVLGLTLLRGTRFPDPEADIGEQELEFALMPHGGDWRAAGVDREAEAYNAPLFVAGSGVASGDESEGKRNMRDGASWAALRIEVDGPARVEVVAIKPAERGTGFVMRLVETGGLGGVARVKWKVRVGGVRAVDLMERPMEFDGLRHEDGVTMVPMGPFRIVSLMVEEGMKA
ncbi:MAG: alpha-mannosidase [Phycisphaerales bacterium]